MKFIPNSSGKMKYMVIGTFVVAIPEQDIVALLYIICLIYRKAFRVTMLSFSIADAVYPGVDYLM